MSVSLRPSIGLRTSVSALTTESTVRLDGGSGVADEIEVAGVTLDSRAVVEGDLYAALPGANVHGATFVAQAVRAGAVAVLTDEAGAHLVRDHGSLDGIPLLVADDPRAVLGVMSSRVYGDPAAHVATIGITGTNGKTTTTYLVDAALRALGRRTGLIGTIETRVADERVPSVRTTPEACDLHGLLAVMREREVSTCVMEVSSHALALHRVDGVVFDVAVFTNLSQDHLDFHGSMSDYFEAKASLFTSRRSRLGVVCIDDEWGACLAAGTEVDVTTFSARADAGAHWRLGQRELPAPSDAVVEAVELLGPDGMRLELPVALPGEHNRIDAALAALALVRAGYDPQSVVVAMREGARVPGRMERVELGEAAPLAYVDFAHTPDAIDATLRALVGRRSGPLVAIVGAGGDRDRGKRPAMGAAAAAVADRVVVTDDNPRREDPAEIRAALLAGAVGAMPAGDASRRSGAPAACEEVPGRAAAIARALALAGPDGIVAVLGKGHEQGQSVGDTVLPFDDRHEVRAAWKRVKDQGVTE